MHSRRIPGVTILGQATWRLGANVGGQSVQVQVGSAGPVTFEGMATAPEVTAVTLTPQLDTLTAIGTSVHRRSSLTR